MTRFYIAIALLALTGTATYAQTDDTGPKTGSFELNFTTRSRFSEIKLLTKRLGIDTPANDYDLSKETFLVYVPEHYDPNKPMGLIVLANYKASQTLPNPILSQLDDANVAFIVDKGYTDDLWQRAGVALDAAYNMQRHYRIDRKRIYAFGGADKPDEKNIQPDLSERLLLNFPEVFTGAFCASGLNAYRNVPVQGGSYPARIPMPDQNSLALAKVRPLVVGDFGDNQVQPFVEKTFTDDGFKFVKVVAFSLAQFHYPNYTTDWIPDALKFMDAATADLTIDTARPATQPAN
jgi:hypothetical protein